MKRSYNPQRATVFADGPGGSCVLRHSGGPPGALHVEFRSRRTAAPARPNRTTRLPRRSRMDGNRVARGRIRCTSEMELDSAAVFYPAGRGRRYCLPDHVESAWEATRLSRAALGA